MSLFVPLVLDQIVYDDDEERCVDEAPNGEEVSRRSCIETVLT